MDNLYIKSGQGDYYVDFLGSIDQLIKTLSKAEFSAILIDENVKTIYHEKMDALFEKVPTLAIPATEEEKTLTGIEKVLSFFQEKNLTRNSVVLAIGGGIIQDIVTFSAHIYYRGIRWMFVPTTLLSMGDSCIGAKCGINFKAYKNQLGVFQSPRHVFICSQFTLTLTERDIHSGFGEILKLILTGSESLFQYQTAFQPGLPNQDETTQFIFESLNVKRQVIEADEYETDYRRILNYGHTFGHALESLTHYEIPHGLGVAWGLDLANFLGWQLGVTSEADFHRIHTFVKEHFGFHLSNPVESRQLVDMTKRDKKVIQGRANLILLQEVGNLIIKPTDYDDNLYNLVEQYMKEFNVVHWD